jgi:antitoxin component YwqK of YwqJK toxin-antitoxin module
MARAAPWIQAAQLEPSSDPRILCHHSSVPALLALLLVVCHAQAADTVRDERRLHSNGSVHEVWTYAGSMSPDTLLRKELFWEDSTPRSRQEFVAGLQHGPSRTWHSNGNKHIEETWADGKLEGTVRHWPDPYGDADDKKRLKPQLEASYEDGVPHGTWREWNELGDRRWMRVERGYQHGKLHGQDTLWLRADRMDHQHQYEDGQLHGRQLGWNTSGEQEYQYRFAHGAPDGPQRRYDRDAIVRELQFTDGVLHGHQIFEPGEGGSSDWLHGLRTLTQSEYDNGQPGRLSRVRLIWQPFVQSNGRIDFRSDELMVDSSKFDEEGRRVAYTAFVEGGLDLWITFHDNGHVDALGRGSEGHRQGDAFVFYDDGKLRRHEAWKGNGRKGLTRVWDRDGRLVGEQTWDHYLQAHRVTTWHSGDVKASQGDITVGTGGLLGRKTGHWQYWTPDGRLLREEAYGEGNSSSTSLSKTTQWLADDRLELEGSQKELEVYTYDEHDPLVLRRTRTVKLIDRSRHGVEQWNRDTLVMERIAPTNPKVVPDEQIIDVLGERALVLEDARFRADRTRKTLDRFNNEGLRHGDQEGWYRDGTPAYSYTYSRGTLREAEEWWSNGELRMVGRWDSDRDGLVLRGLVASDKGGKTWSYERGGGWTLPEGMVEAIRVFRFEPKASTRR